MMKHKIQKLAALMSCLLFSLVIAAQNTDETVTTVADEGTSGMFLATFCPNKDVAIDKDQAELFSIYTDGGGAVLMKMRVQGGKFVVKAGDRVIVKTTEAKTIPLENTTVKRSSVWINDLFSPSEEMSVEDFCSSYPVNEGETIYLLTNMAKNGGFGFTKFTGDVMKRCNFYIVVTKNKTRAAKDIEDGDPVPFLEGEAGNDDGFTAQSVFAKGDANGDGTINVVDIVEMVNYITGKPSASFIFSAADVNSDKVVNTTDIELTFNIILPKK